MKIDTISMPGMLNQYASDKANLDLGFASELEQVQKKAKLAKEDAKLKDACKDFEAMFLNMMYTKMRDTVPDNSLYGTSHGEKIMQSMLDTELTKNMANAGGIGLAAMMYKQLSMNHNKGS